MIYMADYLIELLQCWVGHNVGRKAVQMEDSYFESMRIYNNQL